MIKGSFLSSLFFSFFAHLLISTRQSALLDDPEDPTFVPPHHVETEEEDLGYYQEGEGEENQEIEDIFLPQSVNYLPAKPSEDQNCNNDYKTMENKFLRRIWLKFQVPGM